MDRGALMKTCPRCEKQFPATLEHFQRDKHAACGLYSYCKGCASIKRKARYWASPDRWREKQQDYYKASRKVSVAAVS